jgi:hypothetical protein
MYMIGERRATTLPANIGSFEPVQVTSMVPQVVLAVTSHVIMPLAVPSGGERDAAHLFCPDHKSEREDGITAED